MYVVLAASLISIVEVVAVVVIVAAAAGGGGGVASSSAATTTLVSSPATASLTVTTVAPSLSQFSAMIRTVGIVIAVLPSVTGGRSCSLDDGRLLDHSCVIYPRCCSPSWTSASLKA